MVLRAKQVLVLGILRYRVCIAFPFFCLHLVEPQRHSGFVGDGILVQIAVWMRKHNMIQQVDGRRGLALKNLWPCAVWKSTYSPRSLFFRRYMVLYLTYHMLARAGCMDRVHIPRLVFYHRYSQPHIIGGLGCSLLFQAQDTRIPGCAGLNRF